MSVLEGSSPSPPPPPNESVLICTSHLSIQLIRKLKKDQLKYSPRTCNSRSRSRTWLHACELACLIHSLTHCTTERKRAHYCHPLIINNFISNCEYFTLFLRLPASFSLTPPFPAQEHPLSRPTHSPHIRSTATTFNLSLY